MTVQHWMKLNKEMATQAPCVSDGYKVIDTFPENSADTDSPNMI